MDDSRIKNHSNNSIIFLNQINFNEQLPYMAGLAYHSVLFCRYRRHIVVGRKKER
jgi:hypothetical protein